MNIQRLTKEYSILWFEFDLCGLLYSEYNALGMVFTRKKSRADANPESPPRTQHEINICEVRTPSRKVFTQEHNELSVQQVVQDARGLESEFLHYRVLGLNESSTEGDLKKAYHKIAL